MSEGRWDPAPRKWMNPPSWRRRIKAAETVRGQAKFQIPDPLFRATPDKAHPSPIRQWQPDPRQGKPFGAKENRSRSFYPSPIIQALRYAIDAPLHSKTRHQKLDLSRRSARAPVSFGSIGEFINGFTGRLSFSGSRTLRHIRSRRRLCGNSHKWVLVIVALHSDVAVSLISFRCSCPSLFRLGPQP